MMKLAVGLKSLVTVEITSADLVTAFDAIMEKGISVYSVYIKDDMISIFEIHRNQLEFLRSLTERRGDSLRIIKKKGFYWHLDKLKSRPVLLMGALLLLLLTLYIPTRILAICVEGNSRVSTEEIIDAAKECGLAFGSRRSSVRSEYIKNRIISKIPDIEWLGVNTRGCIAYISIHERAEKHNDTDEFPCSIVASRDGVISSISVSNGTRQCDVGTAVTKGQLLISGYTDCGNVLLSGHAEGEVYAYTSRTITVLSPEICAYKDSLSGCEARYSLLLGKKRINLWKGSGICPIGCDRMYQEYWLTLPGGFRLPVCVVKETILPYLTVSAKAQDVQQVIQSSAEQYLHTLMVGGRILQEQLLINSNDGISRLDGVYGCLEMIGIEKSDRIGESYG